MSTYLKDNQAYDNVHVHLRTQRNFRLQITNRRIPIWIIWLGGYLPVPGKARFRCVLETRQKRIVKLFFV